MDRQKDKKALIKRGVVIFALIIVIYLLNVFADHPKAVERYYSEGLYPIICHILHPVFNMFPFSFGDVLYLLIIVYLIYALVRLIALGIKRRFMRAGLLATGVGIGVLAGILAFYLFWGLNYFRPSAGERLNLRDSTYTKAELQR
jgi:hypothetical protein